MPNLHIGSDPDGKCLVAGPCEGLAFENERIVVPICPAHRAQRLRTRGNGRQSGREETCGPGDDETLLDEISAVMTTSHGAALLSPTISCLPRNRRHRANPYARALRCPLTVRRRSPCAGGCRQRRRRGRGGIPALAAASARCSWWGRTPRASGTLPSFQAPGTRRP